MKRPIPPSTNEIQTFIHCALCLEEYRRTVSGLMSPREYANNEVGWTPFGLQVWCKRHEVNVVHLDFEGMKHPANTTRPKT